MNSWRSPPTTEGQASGLGKARGEEACGFASSHDAVIEDQRQRQHAANCLRTLFDHHDRLRLRGPNGAQFEFTLAAIAQNLRRLAKLVARPPPVIPVECAA